MSLIIDMENFFKLVSFVFSPLHYCKDKIPPQLHSTDSSTSFIHLWIYVMQQAWHISCLLSRPDSLVELTKFTILYFLFFQKFVSRVSTLFWQNRVWWTASCVQLEHTNQISALPSVNHVQQGRQPYRRPLSLLKTAIRSLVMLV